MIDKQDLDWDDVRVFLEAAGGGSLAEAGRALGLSPATASRRLRRLETVLGARLFDRLPNCLTLTGAGRALLGSAEAMRDGAAALRRQAGAQAAAERMPVRISATASVSLFVGRHLADLGAAAAAGGAEITLLSSRVKANLAQRDAEIALRMRRLPETGALAARRLGRVAVAVYAARPGWRGLEMVGLPRSARVPSQAQWLDAFAAAHGAEIRVRIADVSVRHRAVADGAGASLLPCFLGDGDPTLVRIGDPPEALAEDVYLLVHQDLAAVPAVRAVADALAGIFREARGRLAGDGHGGEPRAPAPVPAA